MSFREKTPKHETELKCSSSFKLSSWKILFGPVGKIPKKQVNPCEDEEIESGSSSGSLNALSGSYEADIADDVPEITRWRRAITEDKPAIKQLQNLTGDIASSLYWKRNIDELMLVLPSEELFENSCFPIVQLDSKGELISFTAYQSYPNIPSVPSFDWDDWLKSNYRLKNIHARNVFFVHYMVWEPRQANSFLRLLLETSFAEFLHLQHIIIVKPPKATVPDFYTQYFFPVRPKGLEKLGYDSIQSLLVCLRTTVIQPLQIRTAFEEELGIIMSIVYQLISDKGDAKDTSTLELINFQSQKWKKTLICQLDNDLAGIMVINCKMNLEILNHEFELGPFHGLRKPDFIDTESVDFEDILPEKRISQDSPSLLQMNWEMMVHKIKGTDSTIPENNSRDYSSESDFSEFSDFGFSSNFDIASNDLNEATTRCHGKYEIPSKIGDVEVSIHKAVGNESYFHERQYHGSSNAFVIDFFAIDSNKVNRKLSSFDFLEAAFRTIPDREYCVLVIPTYDFIQFPILDLFVRVSPRSTPNFKQELYLCHKKSLPITPMSVRNAEKNDLVNINHFLTGVKGRDLIYQDILNNCFVKNKNFKSFIFTAEEEIVGISLIDFQDCLDFIQVYFEVEDYLPVELNAVENQSFIKHLILNPIYQSHARFFIRDIMRLADINCLYHVYSKSRQMQPSFVTILRELFPVRPKRKAGLEKKFQPVHVSDTEKKALNDPCGLFFTNYRLCELPKIHVNIVVVVVGASRTALSFLESLIYGPSSCFVRYNNLTCVTPHRFYNERSDTKAYEDLMFCHEENRSKKYASLILSLESYVNIVYGIMTEINRSEKYIVVNNKTTVRYDYLILTCGLQHLSPVPKPNEAKKSAFTSSLSRYLPAFGKSKACDLPKNPVNMFIINTVSDAKNALRDLQLMMHKVKNMPNSRDKKVIIYGHDIDAFMTVHSLLKFGIPGNFIVFMEPFPSETTTVTLFNDPYVDQAVIEAVKNCNVDYNAGFFFYDWALNSEEFITSITFHGDFKKMVIPCYAFFPFTQKLVSDVTFNACRGAGLVYDGRLVIDHNFRTNDHFIYGAGSFTKYARRYYANDKNHEFYDSGEVGRKLAEIIRGKIDPTAQDVTIQISDMVPELTAPKLLYCQLPGDFNFFTLKKPGKELDLETAYNLVDYGEVLVTGDCQMKKGNGYFRLHLGPEGFVESITCFTKDKIDYMDLSCLYGLHEKLLNNLLCRYDMSLITDFFDYFRQPWALIFFHDDFHLLQECNHKIFNEQLSGDKGKTFVEKVVDEFVLNQWNPLSAVTKKKLELEYSKSPIEHKIALNLLEFLESYHKDLPVYSTPGSVRPTLYENDKLPMDRKCNT